MEENQLVLMIINVSVALLSIGGSIVIILMFIFYPSLRSSWRRLLTCLSVCDLCVGVFYCLGWLTHTEKPQEKPRDQGSNFCVLLALFGIFSNCASYFWTCCIALHLHSRVQVMLNPAQSDAEWFSREERSMVSHVFAWGYPIIITLVVGLCHVTLAAHELIVPCDGGECFGCFIQRTKLGWRVAAIYGPLWGSWLFTLFWYVRTWIRFGGLFRSAQQDGHALAVAVAFRWKLILVPLLFILLRIPETAFRIKEYSNFDGSPDWEPTNDNWDKALNYIQALFNPAQGFTNFILFIVHSSQPREALFECLCNNRFCLKFQKINEWAAGGASEMGSLTADKTSRSYSTNFRPGSSSQLKAGNGQNRRTKKNFVNSNEPLGQVIKTPSGEGEDEVEGVGGGGGGSGNRSSTTAHLLAHYDEDGEVITNTHNRDRDRDRYKKSKPHKIPNKHHHHHHHHGTRNDTKGSENVPSVSNLSFALDRGSPDLESQQQQRYHNHHHHNNSPSSPKQNGMKNNTNTSSRRGVEGVRGEGGEKEDGDTSPGSHSPSGVATNAWLPPRSKTGVAKGATSILDEEI